MILCVCVFLRFRVYAENISNYMLSRICFKITFDFERNKISHKLIIIFSGCWVLRVYLAYI